MMQVIDEAYVRAIAELPDGYERLSRWIGSIIEERDMAEAVAKACVSQLEPLRRQHRDLQMALNREVERRRELKLEQTKRGGLDDA